MRSAAVAFEFDGSFFIFFCVALPSAIDFSTSTPVALVSSSALASSSATTAGADSSATGVSCPCVSVCSASMVSVPLGSSSMTSVGVGVTFCLSCSSLNCFSSARRIASSSVITYVLSPSIIVRPVGGGGAMSSIGVVAGAVVSVSANASFSASCFAIATACCLASAGDTPAPIKSSVISCTRVGAAGAAGLRATTKPLSVSAIINLLGSANSLSSFCAALYVLTGAVTAFFTGAGFFVSSLAASARNESPAASLSASALPLANGSILCSVAPAKSPAPVDVV